MAIGVDGLIVKDIEYFSNHVELKLESCLSAQYLKVPWEKSYPINIKIDGDIDYLLVNGKKIETEEKTLTYEIDELLNQ